MKGLGKGLDALLGGYEEPNETAVSTLSVYLIDNNSDQPRKKFDEAKLVELANSIAQHGIVQLLSFAKSARDIQSLQVNAVSVPHAAQD